MLDLDRLRGIKLSGKPIGQRIVANALLLPDYAFPRRTEIVIEGAERLPTPAAGPAFLAMNHTDRYNYWPLQYGLYRRGLGYTATWVKGKYYENPLIARFMDSMNGIPLPSRGYVITTEFRKRHGRVPDKGEYRALRDLVDGPRDETAALDPAASSAARALVGDDCAGFLSRFDALFTEMMREVVALNRRACELGLFVLVFPEGTRRKRLGRGHIGLAQMAQHLGATIVPIGCNGSDRLYPGNAPLSKGGRVVYRVGAPLEVDSDALRAHRVPDDVVPFTPASEAYEAQYRAITDVVMDRIAGLLDDEYLPDERPDASSGSDRFV